MLDVRYVCSITAVSLLISGCAEDRGNSRYRDEIDGLQTQINALQAELNKNSVSIDATQAALLEISSDLRTRIKSGADNLGLLEFKSSLYTSALFTNPIKSRDTWQTVKSSIGSFAVKCLYIGKYKECEEGSQVALFIGNPLMATLKNVEAYVEYGELDDRERPRYDGAKNKHVTFDQPLEPATSTLVTFMLDDIHPSKLGFIRVYIIGPNGISFPN